MAIQNITLRLEVVLFMVVLFTTVVATMTPDTVADERGSVSSDTGYYLGPDIQGPDNKDRLTNPFMHTLPLKDVVEEAWTQRDAQFPPLRVISMVAPVVVRQNGTDGPKYQEGLGYAFLLNSPKYPGLCKMDDGTLVLTMTAALSGEIDIRETGQFPGTYLDENTRTDVILYSKDNGMSWSQPRRIPGYRTTPMNLGGKKLMIRGWNSKIDLPEAFRFWFSDDVGRTWSDEEKVPPLPDGSEVNTDVAMNFPIEGDTIRFMFYRDFGIGKIGRFQNPDPGGIAEQDPRWTAETVMRTYNFRTHTWSEPTFIPRGYRTSEASLTRAKNGDLVGSFRSGRPGIPSPFDGWRAVVTMRSSDEGKTWSKPDIHSLYGHVHHSLLTLPDGRILMTYAARIGELDGRLYRGFEAVFSHDHGKTWDWQHRYILFRGPAAPPHSPQSVLLDDGRIFTVVMHPTSYTWRDANTKGNLIALSNISTVIWQPD